MDCPTHAFVTRYGRTFCPTCGEQGVPPVRIDNRDELIAVADILGVRPDWHEPDEQDVIAVVYGESFDNAGTWPLNDHNSEYCEIYVDLFKNGVLVAQVNLATLFAMACGTVK